MFDRGRYAPYEEQGRALLAHELVHTIQQGGGGPTLSGQQLSVESPTSCAEDEARMVAATSSRADDVQRAASVGPPTAIPSQPESSKTAVMPRPQPIFRSPALLLRSRLRSVASAGRVTLQRAVATSGGEWSTDKYTLEKDIDEDGKPAPAAQGWRGVDITLRFKPNNRVNAELIGLTQSAQSVASGTPIIVPGAEKRSIPPAEAKPANTGTGETDVGTNIDIYKGYNNPIYPVKSTASTSLADPNTGKGLGELGWHYKDNANKVQHKDATLIDDPVMSGSQKDSRQVFETTALATKGVQAGTYYGSVRWGWHTDSAGKFTKIDLQQVSLATPSSTFLKAARMWDIDKSPTGAANVKFANAAVMVTTAPVMLKPPFTGSSNLTVVLLPLAYSLCRAGGPGYGRRVPRVQAMRTRRRWFAGLRKP